MTDPLHPRQYRPQQQMDEWLLSQLHRESAAIAPPPKRTNTGGGGLMGAAFIVLVIGVIIIAVINAQFSSSSSSVVPWASAVVLILTVIITGCMLGGSQNLNNQANGVYDEPQDPDRIVLYPGQSAAAGTYAWVPRYKAGNLPDTWVIRGWEPVVVGLHGALYYERLGEWRNTDEKSYRKWQGGPALAIFSFFLAFMVPYVVCVGNAKGVPQGVFILGAIAIVVFWGSIFIWACKHPTTAKKVGWALAAYEVAKGAHNAHVRHDARIVADELNRRQQR
jgi:hypothetical protein